MIKNKNKLSSELHICVLAPPFFSHLRPMLQLASEMREKNVQVTVACAPQFKEVILKARCRFAEIYINRNSNIGSASETEQVEEEKQRLNEFFDASKKGAVETLAIQMRHRRQDMFANPDEVMNSIIRLQRTLQPDLWVIDQLSYSVTISMSVLELPFFTFCPPHPATIPQNGRAYGMPICWPKFLLPSRDKLAELEAYARSAEKEFDTAANEFLKTRGYPNAKLTHTFSLSSTRAVIFNYPDFGGKTESDAPNRIYMGYSFSREILDDKWASILKVKEKKIYIGLGTFLAKRTDVLRKLIIGLRELFPSALLIAAAGSSWSALRSLADDRTLVESFLPQKAILPFVDCVVHHGGVGSFTEALYFGKPAVVLPFSSDQFNVACDVEQQGLGVVLDPNSFTASDLQAAMQKIEDGAFHESLLRWSRHIRERGPAYAADAVLDLIDS